MVEDGRLTLVDEAALLAELRDLLPGFQAMHARVEAENRVLEPYFAQIHRYCHKQDIGIQRLGADDAWAD